MKNHIRRERKNRKITQETLGKMVNVSRQTINAIETNRYSPSIELAIKLSNLFELTVNELFELEDNIT